MRLIDGKVMKEWKRKTMNWTKGERVESAKVVWISQKTEGELGIEKVEK